MTRIELYDRSILEHQDIFWIPSHLDCFSFERESLRDISVDGDNIFWLDEIDEDSLLQDATMSSRVDFIFLDSNDLCAKSIEAIHHIDDSELISWDNRR